MNRPLTLPSVLFVTVLLVMNFTFSIYAMEDRATPIRFAVIGDRTSGHTPGVYGEIISEIDRLRPDFVINVGDMIEGYSDDADAVRGEWEAYLKLVDPLGVPLYPTPGNHDIWGDAAGFSQAMYEQYMGRSPDYAFDYRGMHVVVLDTSRWETADELPREKLAWLAGDLEEHRNARCTVVFSHKPFWYETLARGNPDPLHDIFKTYGVDAVFTGHYHEYFSGEYDGIQYTSFGSSGGGMSPGITGLEYHFGWVTVDSDGVHTALIKKDSVLPWDEITAADSLAVEKIEKEAFRSEAPVLVDPDVKIDEAVWQFVLKNPTDSFTVADTLRWEVPDGWAVTPDTLPLEIAPGAEQMVAVTVSCQGSLFPAPTFSLDMAYREGREYELTRPVAVMRQIRCVYAGQEPKIDGNLEETDVWMRSESSLFSPEEDGTVPESSQFHFAHDNENLYIAVVCRESEPENIHASATLRDGAVYNDDYVGFFLVPPGEENNTDIYHILLTPGGVVFDQKIRYGDGEIEAIEKGWDMACEVDGTKAGDTWILEARIPLKDLGVTKIASGDLWRVNFGRRQQRLEAHAVWMVPGTCDPKTFGAMILE